MSDAEMSATAQDYVKVIWNAQEWSDEPVTTSFLARRLGVSAPTVSETVRRLSAAGLVEHVPRGAVTLTPRGRREALGMVRRHRIIETFLVSELGYGWDEVHDEAEVLEHACSDRMIEAMDSRLGHPTRDPHGDPIPQPDGSVPSPPAVNLAEAPAGTWTVARLADSDPDLLRYLGESGLVLDARVDVGERPPYSEGVSLRVEDAEAVLLGSEAAAAVWVIPHARS